MNKIIIFTIMAVAAFYWLVINSEIASEKDHLNNAPIIIKTNLSGTCSVSAMGTYTDTKRNVSVTACKVQL